MKRKQVINPIFLMNRTGHRIVQRVGAATYVRSSGGSIGGHRGYLLQENGDKILLEDDSGALLR